MGKFFVVLFFTCSFFSLWSQSLKDKESLDVYVDCAFCNMNDIRNSAPYMNYVREALLADVHVLVTRVSLGSTGYSYSFRFIGRKDFNALEFTRTFSEPADMLQAERQQAIRNTLELGLANYWSQTKMTERLSIQVKEDKSRAVSTATDEVDPWRNWVISMNGGSRLDFESIRKDTRLWGSLEIDRVTEIWRIRNVFYARGDYQVFTKEEEEIRSIIYRKSGSTTIVRSINDHWSAGIYMSANQSTFDNFDLSTRVAPAFEFSIFPYSEVQEREVTVAYRLSHSYRDYTEQTIFDQLSENLLGQSLVMSARFIQPWGNLYAELEGSHFFHDVKQNRLVFEGRFNVRIIKGLSISLSNNFQLINDQRSLPKRDISFEELLLAQRQAATSFRLSGQMGISYTFGSIYNNIVNTRL